MKRLLLAFLLVNLSVLPGQANTNLETKEQGIVALRSFYSVEETANRLESLIKQSSLTLFARIDHQAGADSVGKKLRPTQLFIFGNPQVGTPLMQCNQIVGIDLPQKMLIWQDRSKGVWIGYNNPSYLLNRHNLTDCQQIIKKIEKALSSLANSAAGRSSPNN